MRLANWWGKKSTVKVAMQESSVINAGAMPLSSLSVPYIRPMDHVTFTDASKSWTSRMKATGDVNFDSWFVIRLTVFSGTTSKSRPVVGGNRKRKSTMNKKVVVIRCGCRRRGFEFEPHSRLRSFTFNSPCFFLVPSSRSSAFDKMRWMHFKKSRRKRNLLR